jgi:hypothetical protein
LTRDHLSVISAVTAEEQLLTHLSLVVQVDAQQLWIERLPADAPDLNPDEGVWQHLQQVELRNVICASLRQLCWQLRRAIMRLRSKLWLIRSFFAGAGLSLD